MLIESLVVVLKMIKKIHILGSTGSIGKQTLSVINKNKGDSELRKMAIPAEPNEIKTEKKLNNNNNFIPGKKKRGKTRLKLK